MRVRLAALLLCSFGLFAQARDYWLKTERRGTGFSYTHITVTKLPNGNLRYDDVTHIKIDLGGVKPEDTVETGSYVVDAQLRPLSFEVRAKSPGKETHTAGTRAGNTMVVTVQRNEGLPAKKKIRCHDAFFEVVFEEVVARNAGRKKLRLHLLDTEELKIDTKLVEVLKADSREIEASVKERNFTHRYRIGRNGELREMHVAGLGVRTYPTGAEDARNITYLNTADFFTMMIRSRRSFPNVYKVVRAELQVRWNIVPFRDFRLEDNRQKVLRKRRSGGEFEAVVETTRPSGGHRAAGKRPRAAFLGEDEYIKPKHRDIQAQARAIAGEIKDPVEIVGRLLEWVSANIEYALISERVSGPEVLADKRGKCAHYAILFASLARSLGIPTRIALGQAYTGSEWGGHMWDEVWLGEWIAVDPTAGSFVAGPTHLKLIDSATVDGTQGLATKLIDTLQIEILDFEEEKAHPSSKTGIDGPTYRRANDPIDAQSERRPVFTRAHRRSAGDAACHHSERQPEGVGQIGFQLQADRKKRHGSWPPESAGRSCFLQRRRGDDRQPEHRFGRRQFRIRVLPDRAREGVPDPRPRFR